MQFRTPHPSKTPENPHLVRAQPPISPKREGTKTLEAYRGLSGRVTEA